MNVPRSATSFKPQLTDAQAAAPSSKNSVFVELADRVLHELPEETEKSSDDEGHLKLGRFAYANPNPARRTMSKTPSPTERGSAPPTEGPTGSKSKRSITPTHRFTGDFSDAELSRILKCVSCELAWTARKTVPQKMKHIQSCAKKNGLNDETVRTLLRKELDNLSPVTSASKASTSAPTVTLVPETLLEDVLKDTSKKKPGRRPQVLQTVKSITETRDTILEKARSLLQSSGSARPAFTVEHTSAGPWVAKYGDAPPATQVFSKSSICARVDPVEVAQADITHVFGPSRLAAQSSRLHGAVVRTGAHIAGHSDVSPLTQEAAGANATPSEVYLQSAEDMPPSTQVFAPTAIDHTRLEEAMSIHDTDEDDFARSSPQRPPSPYSPTSPSGSLPGPSKPKNPTKDAHPIPASARSPLNRQTPSPAGDERYVGRSHQQPEFDVDSNEYDDYEWNQWMNDDVWDEEGGACLHYVPQTAGAGPSRLQGGSVAEEPPSLPRHRLAPILKDVLASAGTSVPASSSRPPTKKKRRKKAAASEESEAEAAKASDISQDELNVKMKEAILKDEALHLRILRYEPIRFDVFLQMAVDLGIPAKRSGLKGKVRAFLDQKVHFSRYCHSDHKPDAMAERRRYISMVQIQAKAAQDEHDILERDIH
ncbi:hypothetical protein BN946_scf184470.g10 [Trametes cinnabarina]|uniref:Structure-specific endonuclease subunit SLX4 n=1 Tax=Pycnoporus cinnabarinus TaxID=5643 RepID=A0A060SNY8_PYCCI|nr:hypothetical protein BN946_scf184470.g10 [Trametes cinnabarina]